MRLPQPAIATVRIAAFSLAILALLLSTVGQRYEIVDYAPGGSSYSTIVRPIFVGIFVVALLLALRWQLVGGLLAGFAAAGLMAFASQQLTTTSALLVVLAYAVPGLLWFVLDAHEYSRRGATVAIIGALVVGAAGFALGSAVYARTWGPTHPDSTVSDPPASPALWIWAGAVGPDGASVRAKARNEFDEARLVVSTDESFADAWSVETRDRSDNVVGFRIEDLEPGTTYHYAVEFDGMRDTERAGRFETFPVGPSSFRVVFGSCARVGSNGAVFDAIDDLDPLLYLIIGDFHYGDNGVDNVDDFREVLDLTLTQPGQAALYRDHPIAYVWDDHDFGSNDANGSSVSRAAAMTSYREYVPSYELAGPLSAIYQAFTIGRVRFVLTDARAARDEQRKTDDDTKTMLGAEQKAWLLDELATSSLDHELVVWVNPVPWVAAPSSGSDNWGGYATERREIADFIAANEIDNLLMVSADAHMVAIDDGTNTNFSDTPGPGFPLLQAAPLDRPGSIKGGPYSEGAIAESGQFGVLDIVDDGDSVRATISAHNWQGQQLLSYTFDLPTVSADP